MVQGAYVRPYCFLCYGVKKRTKEETVWLNN